jgi:REP element-mobilizing transposase RayT
LPHFDGREVTQHVTFHLADSLPKHVIQRIDEELHALPLTQQDAERRKRVEAWLDAGHGSCILREPAVAAMAQGALLHFDAQRYRLLAWVVMPNHVHVLFQPLHDWRVAKIVASWKKFTATRIGHPGNANLPIGDVPLPVWHREYWDRYIRDDRHFQRAVEYIHQNPVKAGLVTHPEDWPWSSASHPGNANLPIGDLT